MAKNVNAELSGYNKAYSTLFFFDTLFPIK